MTNSAHGSHLDVEVEGCKFCLHREKKVLEQELEYCEVSRRMHEVFLESARNQTKLLRRLVARLAEGE